MLRSTVCSLLFQSHKERQRSRERGDRATERGTHTHTRTHIHIHIHTRMSATRKGPSEISELRAMAASHCSPVCHQHLVCTASEYKPFRRGRDQRSRPCQIRAAQTALWLSVPAKQSPEGGGTNRNGEMRRLYPCIKRHCSVCVCAHVCACLCVLRLECSALCSHMVWQCATARV